MRGETVGIVGTPRKRHHKWKFVIEIEGIASAAFKTCSELSAEIATVAISEGGRLTPEKSAGRVTITKITLERGATSELDMWSWFREVADIAANTGLVDDEYKRDIDIVQQDRDGSELVRWRVYRAFPTKFSAGDWDNEADEFRMESVELDFDSFEPI